MIGTVLDGRYLILSVVGQGDVGTIYKSSHQLMNRLVAIKMLRADYAASEANRQRFQREAKLVSALNHPNIVAVYDFGFAPDGAPYLVMDLLSGMSLAELLEQEGKPTLEKTVEIISQCCEALAHAHKLGVTHRDLKPGNIMLVPAEDGGQRVKVVDFGIAVMVSDDGKQTNSLTGEISYVGNPLYFSPERCFGKAVDARSDIYSLACVMYEMLAGRPPFAGEIVKVVSQHAIDKPAPISGIEGAVSIPAGLENVLMKALEKDPEKRYLSMPELLKAIKLAAGQSQKSKTQSGAPAGQSLVALGRQFAGRHARALVSALILLVVLSGLAIWWQKTDDGTLALTRLKMSWCEQFAPADDSSLAQLCRVQSDIYEKRGQYEQAAAVYLGLLETLKHTNSSDSAPILSVETEIGDIYLKGKKLAEARRYYDQVRAALERKRSESTFVSNPRANLALTQQQVDIEEKMPSQYAEDLEFSLHALGQSFLANQKPDMAIHYLRKAVDLRAARRGPDDLIVGESCHGLAKAYDAAGDNVRALSFYNRALHIAALDPAAQFSQWLYPDYVQFCIKTSNYGMAGPALKSLRAQDGQETAAGKSSGQNESDLHQLLSLIGELKGVHPDWKAVMARHLGDQLNQDGNASEAIACYMLAREQKSAGANVTNTLPALQNLAITYRQLGRYDSAESFDREALAEYKGAERENNIWYVGQLCQLGEDVGAQKKTAEAEKIGHECLRLSRQLKEGAPQLVALSYNVLAQVRNMQGRFAECAQLNGQAAQLLKKVGRSADNELVIYLTRQGIAYMRLKRFDLAEEPMKTACQMASQPGYKGEALFPLDSYKKLCEMTKRPELAAKLKRQMDEVGARRKQR